jgi:hypothetical protein
MRPTVIRLIVGGALGIAFSISLWLPGTVVFPEDARIRHLAAPEVPSTMVVRAAPVAAPKKPPAPRRVVVRPVYVPPVPTAPVASVVRQAPSRSRPATKPVIRRTPPAQRPVVPLSTPRRIARKAKKAKRRTWEVDERRSEDRERDFDRGDDDDGDERDDDGDDGRDDDGHDEGDDDEGGDDEGDDD